MYQRLSKIRAIVSYWRCLSRKQGRHRPLLGECFNVTYARSQLCPVLLTDTILPSICYHVVQRLRAVGCVRTQLNFGPTAIGPCVLGPVCASGYFLYTVNQAGQM